MTVFRRLAMPEIVEIVPPWYRDHRGSFCETYKRSAFEAQGIAIDWMQDNHSISVSRGTVRGLHFQAPPVAQDKLIRVLKGSVFDVALDIRRGSPSYGRWLGVELSAERSNQLLVPIGFAHGFMTLAADAEVMYKVSAPYSKAGEGVVLWNDPELAIAWPDLGVEPVADDRDRLAPRFADLQSPFVYQG